MKALQLDKQVKPAQGGSPKQLGDNHPAHALHRAILVRCKLHVWAGIKVYLVCRVKAFRDPNIYMYVWVT